MSRRVWTAILLMGALLTVPLYVRFFVVVLGGFD
jgi:hypothetical protein